MLKIYLSGAWSRKAEIREIAQYLELVGLNVQSRWLWERTPELTQECVSDFMKERALIDTVDVSQCHVFVRFSDNMKSATVPTELITGGRMVEMGMALAMNKLVMVIGGHQTVFDYLPEVIHLEDLNELVEVLLPLSDPRGR